MNIDERRQELIAMIDWARQEGYERYEVYLDKDYFYAKARDFILAKKCQHRQELCDLVASNGRHMYFYFCLDCGVKLTHFLPYRELTEQQKNSGVSQDIRRAILSEKYKAMLLLQDFYRAGWMPAYNAYLNSEHWQELREKVLYRDGFRCQLNLWGCTRAATQVHHLTYERVTREKMSDLTSVCKNCHEQQHERKFYEEPQPEY